MSLHALTLLSLLAHTSSAHAKAINMQPRSPQASAPPPAVHQVDVGNGNYQYSPQVTYAAVGDVVQFNFYPTNHSVTRAEYGYPCIPYELTGPGKVGFYSGHFLTQQLVNVCVGGSGT